MKQKLNNNRNHSAIGSSLPPSQSPYRFGSTRNDGGIPTRPITPIKTANQQNRYPHYNGSSASQITNSMLNQDESQITKNPAAFDLSQAGSNAGTGNMPPVDKEQKLA